MDVELAHYAQRSRSKLTGRLASHYLRKQTNFSKYNDHIPKSGHHRRFRDKNNSTIVGCRILQVMGVGKSVWYQDDLTTPGRQHMSETHKSTTMDMYAENVLNFNKYSVLSTRDVAL